MGRAAGVWHHRRWKRGLQAAVEREPLGDAVRPSLGPSRPINAAKPHSKTTMAWARARRTRIGVVFVQLDTAFENVPQTR
jgi:hypothetical protein